MHPIYFPPYNLYTISGGTFNPEADTALSTVVFSLPGPDIVLEEAFPLSPTILVLYTS